MQVEFAESQRSSVGVEWELMLADPANGQLAGVAPEIFDALAPTAAGTRWTATTELLTNTVEVTSGVGGTVGEAIADIRAGVDAVSEQARELGVSVLSSGSHPFAQWYDQTITDKTRYNKLVERTQWWGRNMMIWGVHVHVGVEDVSKVMPLVAAVTTHLPHFQAISASSPFWAGESTGYASNRALVFQQLPTAGLPWHLDTWADYVAHLDSLEAAGIIADPTESRWDVRPAPRWGTIEMRACDSVATMRELEGVTALAQTLVEYFSRKLDADETITWLPAWYVRENKWRAARYGLDARIIADANGAEVSLRDDLHRLLDNLAPVAVALECANEFDAIAETLAAGVGYERQLAVAEANGGSLTAVVEHLLAEFTAGRPLAPTAHR